MTLTVDMNAEIDTEQAAIEKARHFKIVAYTGGKLRVDGFDYPVVVDLDGLEAEGAIPIAIKHDLSDDMILGQANPDETVNDGKTLVLGGVITAIPELSPAVKRVLQMADNGHKWQASIGARFDESDLVEIAAGESVFVNGRNQEGPFTLASKSVLRETSVLGNGADKYTSFTLTAEATTDFRAEAASDEETASDELDAAEADMPDESGFEEWCSTELGIDPTSLNERAREVFLQQYAFEKKTTKLGAHEDTLEAQMTLERKILAQEELRVRDIKAMCKGDYALSAAAINAGWTREKTENEVLKQRLRGGAPAGHVRSSTPEQSLQAIQGGILLRAGVALDNPQFCGELGIAMGLPSWLRAGINAEQKQRTMEAAYRNRDMSLVDLCKAAVAIDGGRSRHIDGSNLGYIKAAISGGSLADIFTTNINARFIQKLAEHPDTTVGWTQDGEAPNFMLQERGRMLKGPRLSKHGRGGQADEATRNAIMQSYRIARYSQQFKIDEMDMIDDRFNVLQDIPDEMALACGRLRPDLVYSILKANGNINKEDGTSSALFSASQPGGQWNYLASGAPLNAATLAAAMATIFNYTENGVGIESPATHLLVPAVMLGTAAALLQSKTIVMAGTAGSVTTKGNVNEFDALQRAWGMIQPVSDHRLTNGVTDPNTGTVYAGSSTQWYLAAAKTPTIEVAYLRSTGKAPQVRQWTMDRDGEWGIGWDVKQDIGAKALAWQGLYSANQ